jgi:hypothetical protein
MSLNPLFSPPKKYKNYHQLDVCEMWNLFDSVIISRKQKIISFKLIKY